MHTTALTTSELAVIDTLPRFGSAIQDETLALRKRSGVRYGTCVGKGSFSIVTTAYKIGRNGRPTGTAKVETVLSGLAMDAVPAALRAL